MNGQDSVMCRGCGDIWDEREILPCGLCSRCVPTVSQLAAKHDASDASSHDIHVEVYALYADLPAETIRSMAQEITGRRIRVLGQCLHQIWMHVAAKARAREENEV